uniref:DUF659 domain-containing protein n=1 Tax=Anopheles funestus TaxID=62324 RepID=A0A182RIF5_ANOFN
NMIFGICLRLFVQITLPSRATLSGTMLNTEYEEVMANVMKSLANAKTVCLTTDGWTDINNQSYLAATAHFIQESDCTLKSFLLECGPFEVNHTSRNIANWLESVMDKYKISDKVFNIITDNASNMKLAVSLKKKIFLALLIV